MAERGRPSDYTPELGEKICNLIGIGKTVTSMCREDETLPHSNTIFRWVGEKDDFRVMFARARIRGCEAVFDTLCDVADDGSGDWIIKKDKRGREFRSIDQEHVQRSRLRVETRKWYLAKVMPKLYGDHITHELTGPEGGAIQLDAEMRSAKIDAIYAAVMHRTTQSPALTIEHDVTVDVDEFV